MLRRKEEGKLKAFEKYLVNEKKNTFLDALDLELFPCPLLKSIFIVGNAIFGIFWALLGLAQSKFLRRLLVSRFY